MTLFCRHSRVTWPHKFADENSPHVVCLDCGIEWDYDWTLMKKGKRRNLPGKGDSGVASAALNDSGANVRASRETHQSPTNCRHDWKEFIDPQSGMFIRCAICGAEIDCEVEG